MWIYLMRHGIAREAEPGGDDFGRALTARGAEKTRQAARGMRRLKPAPEWVLFSPLTRAVETARIVADILAVPPERRRQTELLTPEQDCIALLRQELAPLEEHGSALLVGHEPQLSRVVSLLVCGTMNGLRVELRKASLCAVSCEPPLGPGCGRLQFLLRPKQLRALA
jgi:phosphohistidine phosphatase